MLNLLGKLAYQWWDIFLGLQSKIHTWSYIEPDSSMKSSKARRHSWEGVSQVCIIVERIPFWECFQMTESSWEIRGGTGFCWFIIAQNSSIAQSLRFLLHGMSHPWCGWSSVDTESWLDSYLKRKGNLLMRGVWPSHECCQNLIFLPSPTLKNIVPKSRFEEQHQRVITKHYEVAIIRVDD